MPYTKRSDGRKMDEIRPIKEKYDYIIIDTPPSLGLLTLNALNAADSVIIPVQCEYYALEGIGQLLNTITLVKENLNPNLSIEGILLFNIELIYHFNHEGMIIDRISIIISFTKTRNLFVPNFRDWN